MDEQLKIKEEELVEEEPTSSRMTRRERRAERQANRQVGGLGWIAGLVFIAIGVFYLLYDAGFLPAMKNWWALFILLPAIGTISAALGGYRRNGGNWTIEVIVPLLIGIFLLGLTFVFLFDLYYSWLFPLFLICAGLFFLISPIWGRRKSS